MTKYFILLLLCLGLCGCASVKDRINQVESGGIEKTYDYSYKKVFYACEDTIPRIFWMMLESNFDEGDIFAIAGKGIPLYAGIKIKKIDENKTLVKILRFHGLHKEIFYRDFFDNLDALLKRE